MKAVQLSAALLAATLAACSPPASNDLTAVVSVDSVPAATTSAPPITVVPTTAPPATSTERSPSALGDPLLGAVVPAEHVLYFHSTDPTWRLRSFQVAYGPPVDQSSFYIVGDGDLAERPRAIVSAGPTGVLAESAGSSSATMGAVVEPAEVSGVASIGRTSWANDIPITELDWPAPNGYTASMVAVGLDIDEAADLAEHVTIVGTTPNIEPPAGYHLLGPAESQVLTASAFFASDDVGMYVNCANDGEVGLVGLQMAALARTVTRLVAGSAIAQRADPAFGPAASVLDGAHWLMDGWWCNVWSGPVDPNGGEVPVVAEQEMEQFLASLALDDEASLRGGFSDADLLLDAGEPTPTPTTTEGAFSIGAVDASALPYAQFTPDGGRIAVTILRPAGGPESTVLFIDADTGAQLMTLPIAMYTQPGLLPISGDGRLLFDGTVLRNTATGAPEVTLARGPSAGCSDFSPDGTLIVVTGRQGQGSGSVEVYSTSTGELLSGITTPDSYLMCPEFFPDGKRILLPTLFPTTRVWDISSDEMVLSIGAEYAFPTIGDNGRVLAIGGGEPRLIDATTGGILGSLPGLPMLFSPDGQRLAVHRIERTPDGDPVPDGSFVIWDVTADSVLTDVACDCSDSGLAGTSTMSFNADGSRIVVIRGGMAEVYDATTGELISTLEVEGAKVISVAYSPDGTRIVTANDNGTVRIWDDP